MEMNYYSVTTDVGNRKMNEAAFSEEKLQLYEIAVGDGSGEVYSPTTDMTELKNEKWRGLISKLSVEENVAIVETVIPSSIGGFTIREIGVFDNNNNMIAVGNTPETAKVSDDSGIINEMKLQIEFSLINSDVLELITDPNILTATKQDLEEIKNPEFDDSGTTDGINSFEDFMNRFKSKINLFDFFRDLKAGLKYVVHQGRIMNTQDVTQEGFAMDARQANPNIPGTLGAQISDLNNNINETYKPRGNVNAKNEISNIGTYGITKDVPFPDTDYVAVSFGRKGYHWNFPVLLFNNWGDSVPLRMFTMKSSDGINYTPSEYKQIITNSDFALVSGIVNAIAGQSVEIPGCPTSSNYIPIIVRASVSVSHQTTITYNGGKWYVYTDKTQELQIRFNKYPI